MLCLSVVSWGIKTQPRSAMYIHVWITVLTERNGESEKGKVEREREREGGGGGVERESSC